MNVKVGIGGNLVSGGLLAQTEPRLTDSTPPSVASSENYAEDSAIELWDELDVMFQVQEVNFIEQDESALLGLPGPLFDIPILC